MNGWKKAPVIQEKVQVSRFRHVMSTQLVSIYSEAIFVDATTDTKDQVSNVTISTSAMTVYMIAIR